ncbi:MAG: hypothetical protein ACI9OJ_005765 [Myxococcota bacterium]|jgi:hypothetical protein
MLSPMSRGLITLLVSALAVAPIVGAAHGPTPAGIDILLSDEAGRADAVKLTRGGAIRVAGTWHYLCRSLWTAPDSPIMMSPDGETVLIAALDGLFQLSRSGAVVDLASNQLTSANTRAFHAINGKGYALTGFSGGSTVWRVDVAPDGATDGAPDGATVTSVFESERTIKTLGAQGEQLLVGYLTDDQSLELLRIGLDGQPLGPPEIIAGPIEGTITFAPIGDTLYLRVLGSNRYRLLRIDASNPSGKHLTELADSDTPIHGPVAAGDNTLVSVERLISTIVGDVITPLDSELNVSCLRARPGHGPFSCVLPNILAAKAPDGSMTGGFGDPLFRLEDLTSPLLEGLDSDLAANCELDWLDFGQDAGLVDIPMPDTVESTEMDADIADSDTVVDPNSTTGSCSSAPGGTPSGLIWLALVSLGLYWNSCRRMLRIRSRLA